MSAASTNATLQQFGVGATTVPAQSRFRLPMNTVQQAIFQGNVSTGPLSPLNMIVPSWILAPSGANQTWVLPTAFNILQAFSNSVRTGEVIALTVANRSTAFTAFLQGVSGAGMSSAGYQTVTLGSGVITGGSIEQARTVFLEFNAISTDGKTGSFLIY
jgi:hypothetical protein